MSRELKNYGLYGLSHLGFIVKFILKIQIDLVSPKQLFMNCSIINQLTHKQLIIQGNSFAVYQLLLCFIRRSNQTQFINNQLASETESQFNIQNSMSFYGHPDLMLEYN
ncbi:Hypothetical_protein [Hexamita inflata]|uniref:Hypothetical_protein n=1 Tax=Hexamita inflata TaxID=28002 RepID=A0AA86TPW8_9EUKA|nr:Hypothetical protein HINF_LOCUS10037 [Hexamita inflata]